MNAEKLPYHVKLTTRKGASITLEIDATDQYVAVHEAIESLCNDISFDGTIYVYEQHAPVTRIENRMVKVYESKLKF